MEYEVIITETLSRRITVEANSREEAEEMGYDIDIETEWNGNSVFTYDDAQLAADGEPRDITVECLEDEDEDEDDEDEE